MSRQPWSGWQPGKALWVMDERSAHYGKRVVVLPREHGQSKDAVAVAVDGERQMIHAEWLTATAPRPPARRTPKRPAIDPEHGEEITLL